MRIGVPPFSTDVSPWQHEVLLDGEVLTDALYVNTEYSDKYALITRIYERDRVVVRKVPPPV